MKHIWKSLIVITLFVPVAYLSVKMVWNRIGEYRWHIFDFKKNIATLLVLALLNVGITHRHYMYPFEQSVNLKLYAVLEVPEGYKLTFPREWIAAYEQFGLFAEAFNFSPTESRIGVPWPEMDLKHHVYIISFGQEMLSLTFNAWETIDYPIHTGAGGHAELSEDFDPNKVYIYEIPKIRIDNNNI